MMQNKLVNCVSQQVWRENTMWTLKNTSLSLPRDERKENNNDLM